MTQLRTSSPRVRNKTPATAFCHLFPKFKNSNSSFQSVRQSHFQHLATQRYLKLVLNVCLIYGNLSIIVITSSTFYKLLGKYAVLAEVTQDSKIWRIAAATECI
jgi:hypothetical protein